MSNNCMRRKAEGGKWVGQYSPHSRRVRLCKFWAKRERRLWDNQKTYRIRKDFAASRVRVKGRFISLEKEGALIAEGKLLPREERGGGWKRGGRGVEGEEEEEEVEEDEQEEEEEEEGEEEEEEVQVVDGERLNEKGGGDVTVADAAEKKEGQEQMEEKAVVAVQQGEQEQANSSPAAQKEKEAGDNAMVESGVVVSVEGGGALEGRSSRRVAL